MPDIPNDTAVSKALHRRHELEAELDEINTFLKLYEQFSELEPGALTKPTSANLSSYSKQNAQVAHVASYETPLQIVKGEATLRQETEGGYSIPQGEFTSLARLILLKNGRPLTSVPLLDRFHSMGRRLGGRDELRNLTTKLWRAQDAIVKIPGAGYWPVDEPCAEVSYVPSRNGKNVQTSGGSDTHETSEAIGASVNTEAKEGF